MNKQDIRETARDVLVPLKYWCLIEIGFSIKIGTKHISTFFFTSVLVCRSSFNSMPNYAYSQLSSAKRLILVLKLLVSLLPISIETSWFIYLSLYERFQVPERENKTTLLHVTTYHSCCLNLVAILINISTIIGRSGKLSNFFKYFEILVNF